MSPQILNYVPLHSTFHTIWTVSVFFVALLKMRSPFPTNPDPLSALPGYMYAYSVKPDQTWVDMQTYGT
jgi:hypothetical protein